MSPVIKKITANNQHSLKTLDARGIVFPDEVLQLMPEDIKIVDDINSGSYFRPDINTLVIGGQDRALNEYYQKMIVLHEGGHAIHVNKKIITENYVDPKFTSFYQKLQTVVKGNEGKLNDLLWNLGYANSQNITKTEQVGILHDTLGALTKGGYGAGHKLSYYLTGNHSMMEVFAHSITLARLDNEFQNIDPIVKELVDLMKEYGSNILEGV